MFEIQFRRTLLIFISVDMEVRVLSGCFGVHRPAARGVLPQCRPPGKAAGPGRDATAIASWFARWGCVHRATAAVAMQNAGPCTAMRRCAGVVYGGAVAAAGLEHCGRHRPVFGMSATLAPRPPGARVSVCMGRWPCGGPAVPVLPVPSQRVFICGVLAPPPPLAFCSHKSQPSSPWVLLLGVPDLFVSDPVSSCLAFVTTER